MKYTFSFQSAGWAKSWIMTAKIAKNDVRTSHGQFRHRRVRPRLRDNVINWHLTGGGHEKCLISQTLLHTSAGWDPVRKTFVAAIVFFCANHATRWRKPSKIKRYDTRKGQRKFCFQLWGGLLCMTWDVGRVKEERPRWSFIPLYESGVVSYSAQRRAKTTCDKTYIIPENKDFINNEKFPHFSFRVLQNHEVANNSVTTNEDIIGRANQGTMVGCEGFFSRSLEN